MAKIIKIAISGGPCSGKTTAIDKVVDYFKDKVAEVYVIPETARILLEQGMDRSNQLEFQRAVFDYQIKAENELENQINSKYNEQEDVCLIICDRGVADGFSYLNKEDRKAFMEAVGMDLVTAWSRYDAVMFLETSSSYENDENRTENESEALKLSNELLSVWMGHPHLRYIKAEDVIDEKIHNLKKEIKTLLKSIELEKKYLIEYPNIEAFAKYKPYKAEIEQIYLLSPIGSHRIRKRGNDGAFAYYETLKLRLSGDKCLEYENIISKEIYDELKKEADPNKHPIVKDRYCFLYDYQYFEMDVYPFWNDRAVLELELRSRNQEVNIPPEIKIIKDVSKDKKYKNSYLARNV